MKTKKNKNKTRNKQNNTQPTPSLSMPPKKSIQGKGKEYTGNINRDNSKQGEPILRIVKIRRDIWDFIFIFCSIASVIVVYFMTNNANKLTEESLGETRESIKLIKQNYIIENRAWVTLQMENAPRSRIEANEHNNNGIGVYWTITNFGKTPAENMRMGHYTCVGNMPTFEKRDIIYDFPYTMAPNEEKPLNYFHEIRNDSISGRVILKKTKFFFYGIITYTDIYSRNDTTEFMFVYAGDNALMTPISNRIK